MPIYEYHCQACKERFEKLVRASQQAGIEIVCPACQSADVRRLISAPAIHTGGPTATGQDATESTPSQPAVFGRKELNQVIKSKDS